MDEEIGLRRGQLFHAMLWNGLRAVILSLAKDPLLPSPGSDLSKNPCFTTGIDRIQCSILGESGKKFIGIGKRSPKRIAKLTIRSSLIREK